MASSFSTLLRLELMADGEKSNTWGPIANLNFGTLVGEAISGLEVIAVTGGTDVLTASNGASDQARNAVLKFTGTLTSNEIIEIPATSWKYTIWNATSGSYTLTVGVSGGTAVTVAQGAKTDIFTDGTDTYEVFSEIVKQGKQTIFVPAQAITPPTTNGCGALETVEISAGKPSSVGLPFDTTTQEYAEFAIAMPKSWNNGTVTFKVFWTANSATSDGVAWELQAVSTADNDAIDATYGTAVAVVDNAQGATYRSLISDESAAVTVGGSPGSGEMTYFRVSRDPANGSDDLAADAILLGVQVFFTTNAVNDE